MSGSERGKPANAALLQPQRAKCNWKHVLAVLFSGLFFALLLPYARAEESPAREPSAKQLVADVVYNELRADREDHSRWIYRDHNKEPGKDVVQIVIETNAGEVKKTIEKNGRPLDAQERQQDEAKMMSFEDDPSVREKQRRGDQEDDSKARALMKMLPDAFLWTQTAENGDTVTLAFRPNPQFQPPTRDAKVFAAMAGTMVVDREAKRLKRLSGALIKDVTFGWGLLGRLQKGGTFNVEHTEIAPGIWRITGTHVHIKGKALLFKSINEQEDDETSNYKPAPPTLTVAQAIQMLNDGTAEKLTSE